MVAILVELDKSETKLEWALALVHGATALRPEECFALKWCDVDYANNQILVRRAWSKGKPTCGKTRDRKSTRLNSSHSQISYAVFCLKKKRPHRTTTAEAARHAPSPA